MKTILLLLALALAGPSAALAQNNQLAIDQAAVLPSLATPGSGTLYDLAEYTDAQGNTYQAGSFTGAVHFGSFAFAAGADTEVVVAKRNAAGVYQWAVAGGGPGTQRGKALAVDAAGNVYVTGFFDSATAMFGATTLTNARPAGTGTSDVFVGKVSAAGAWQWAVSAGGGTRINGNDYATAVAVDALGGVYVAGTFTSSVAFFGPTIQLATTDPYQSGRETVFIAKISSPGIWQWARRSEYYGGIVSGVIADATDVYLVSQFRTLAQFGVFTVTSPYPAGGIAIAKIDASGAWQWAAKAQSNARETSIQCNGLTVGARNDLYLAGTFNGDTATFGRTRLVNRGLLAPPPNGALPYYRTYDAYLARLDVGTGTWRWAVQSRGDGYESFSAPLLDGKGGLYLGIGVSEPGFPHSPIMPGHQFGSTNVLTPGGSADVIIAKLDTAGAWRWIARAGGTNDESAAPKYIDGQGQVLIAGTFGGPSLTLNATTTLVAAPTASYTNYTAFTARLGANGPLAVREPAAASFVVYPNPAHRAMTIAGLPAGQVIQLLDALGRVVLTGTVPARGELQLLLPAGVPTGLYVVRAGKQARRVIVE